MCLDRRAISINNIKFTRRRLLPVGVILCTSSVKIKSTRSILHRIFHDPRGSNNPNCDSRATRNILKRKHGRIQQPPATLPDLSRCALVNTVA